MRGGTWMAVALSGDKVFARLLGDECAGESLMVERVELQEMVSRYRE